MEFSDNTEFSATDVINCLRQYDPSVGKAVSDGMNKPLSNYMKSLYTRPNYIQSDSANRSRKIFLRTLHEHLLNSGSPDLSKQVCDELEEHNTLQTGPHAQLITAPYSFYTNAGCYIGLKRAGYRHYLSYTCATNKFATRKNYGAGFINIGSVNVNIFGLSRTKLEKRSLISAEGPFEFRFTGTDNLNDKVRFELENIRTLSEDIEEDCVVDAFNRLNKRILKIWEPDSGIHSTFIDDRFFCCLVSAHLSDPFSPLSKLFDHPDRTRLLLEGMERAAQSRVGSMFPYGTDLFWGVGNEKIHQLRLRDGYLYKVGGQEREPTPFSRMEIVRGLQAGDLVPDALTTFLVASIFPCFRALGGFFQVAYLPKFVDIFMSAFDDESLEEQSFIEDIRRSEISAWGMHVLEEPDEVFGLLSNLGNDKLMNKLDDYYGGRTLADTTRDLSLFRTHQRWAPVFTNGGTA